MRKLIAWLFFSLLILTFFPFQVKAARPPSDEQVYFSPKGGCTAAIIKNLDQVEKWVLVQAYSFTSLPIAEALVNAHKRGVKVKVLLDKSQLKAKGSKLNLLVAAGIPVSIDTKHSIAHNKVMIIDGSTVLTGSFNFTTAAEDRNAENLLVIRDKKIAKKYQTNWDAHFKHSDPYPAGEE
jgi:phosphatidylserine/phosphatidylglycerophosphate/cardiolipin synthase-like enzyme